MKVGLYGIQGVYNFGCEAIIRGAYSFIKSIYPNCEVYYYSYDSQNDKKVLEDLQIEIISVEMNKTIQRRIFNKITKTIGYNKRFLLFNADKIIDSVDLIVSVGGDIYTIPQILREKKRYPYYNPLVSFCDKAIKKGKEVIVYGASVGPWGEYQKAVDYNINALSKYKLILCREKETIEYLKSKGLNNVMFFPDPAFQIRVRETNKKNYIGINFSPLSLKELYGSYDDAYVKKISTLMDRLYETTSINLMFIPHVLSKNESDNDLLFMKKIVKYMKHYDKVIFADTSEGFIGVKKYISQCYVVIAARMHCAINAIDENIPAIFLSYSQKSIGMCKYIYGNDEYLIPLKDIEKELINKAIKAIQESEMLSNRLKSRNEEIREYYESNLNAIRKILDKELGGE